MNKIYTFTQRNTKTKQKENKRIYLASPHMGGLEESFIKEAFDTNWIAPLGPNVNINCLIAIQFS